MARRCCSSHTRRSPRQQPTVSSCSHPMAWSPPMAETGATASRWLIAGEFRAFPMRFVLAGLAIAIGVALAFAVHVINRSAAESFAQAVRSAAGGADLQVRGASGLGFDEGLYPKLMRSEERRVGKECRSRWSPYH